MFSAHPPARLRSIDCGVELSGASPASGHRSGAQEWNTNHDHTTAQWYAHNDSKAFGARCSQCSNEFWYSLATATTSCDQFQWVLFQPSTTGADDHHSSGRNWAEFGRRRSTSTAASSSSIQSRRSSRFEYEWKQFSSICSNSILPIWCYSNCHCSTTNDGAAESFHETPAAACQ